MILWQRQASSLWLAKNEALLQAIAGPTLALISRPDRARITVEVACHRRAEAERLLQQFGGATQSLPREYLKLPPHPPIRIGRRLVVVSEASTEMSKGMQLIIPAGGSFGTGEHPTTAMSLRLLEETTRKFAPGWRLFDAGTGTGILALAARKMGAAKALGLDNDPRAIVNARRNARLNHIGRVRFAVGDILRFKADATRRHSRGSESVAPRYEIATANLFSQLVIAALPTLHRALTAHGELILSGVLRPQLGAVGAALGKAGFSVEKTRRRGKWVALLARRKS